HMDTVFPEGTATERPFTIKDGRAYGPGVIDMKISHVMLYFAIKQLAETKSSIIKNVEIILNSDEEIGTISSRALIEERARDKRCVFVMEPGRGERAIVSFRRGVRGVKPQVTGKAAHSSTGPANGRR